MAAVDTSKPYFGLMDLMKRRGVTQNELANELGIDRATFNVKINRNNGRDFTFSEAIKIASFLGDSIDDFF